MVKTRLREHVRVPKQVVTDETNRMEIVKNYLAEHVLHTNHTIEFDETKVKLLNNYSVVFRANKEAERMAYTFHVRGFSLLVSRR